MTLAMNSYKYMFQEYLRKWIRSFRTSRKISQEHMSEMIHVSPRSYFDQEHGKYGFSAISLISFLLLLTQEELMEFLDGYRSIAEEIAKGNLEAGKSENVA